MKKLTQAVFREKRMPKWTKSAAVDYDGVARYHDVPKSELKRSHTIWQPHSDTSVICGYGYDTTNWQNSAIDRGDV
ncbi:hypothetical protein [Psychrobacter sp. I-STPA6b]|uniref:hypothetical protein n=1 Tax=Psychrobacter sp. I-STPA6b TaxID=2585718 RepID=UPI001D0C3467|nr:hypothetical protein [Psychrobacter sp. I-STPA6b]